MTCAAMVEAIRDSLARRPVVLVLSGGLGPTEDDLTREAVAEALGRPLEHRDDLLGEIQERFASRGWTMGDSNRKQALIPRGASAIPLAGTAPGFSRLARRDLGGGPARRALGTEADVGKTVEPLLRTGDAAAQPSRQTHPHLRHRRVHARRRCWVDSTGRPRPPSARGPIWMESPSSCAGQASPEGESRLGYRGKGSADASWASASTASAARACR